MADVFLNGDYVEADKAKISVFDRGFLFGDGVYEVIPVYQGHFFQLNAHLSRLNNSLHSIQLAQPYSYKQWSEILEQVVARNVEPDQAIYLQVSRGTAARDHVFPEGVPASVFVMSQPLKPVPEDFKSQGVKAVTLADMRWQRCDIKAISLLANAMSKQQAKEAGALEALLIRDGKLTEGAASNAYAIFDNTIYTAPKDRHILPGVTRDLVLSLARNLDIEVVEQAVDESRLNEAQEIWISSSTKELLPVTTLNDDHIADGRPGKLWQQIDTEYQQLKRELTG